MQIRGTYYAEDDTDGPGGIYLEESAGADGPPGGAAAQYAAFLM
jgi:hypothetical protein